MTHPQATRFTHMIAEHPALMDHPFTLIDVGCHGGIYPLHEVFGHNARSTGFDIEAGEVARLNALELPHLRFIHRRIKGPDDAKAGMLNGINTQFVARTSAYAACQILGVNAAKQAAQEAPPAGRHVAPPVTLDAFLKEENSVADFIKIDTDGEDFAILKGARDGLQTSALGVMVECGLNGPHSDDANLLRNVDAFLQGLGF